MLLARIVTVHCPGAVPVMPVPRARVMTSPSLQNWRADKVTPPDARVPEAIPDADAAIATVAPETPATLIVSVADPVIAPPAIPGHRYTFVISPRVGDTTEHVLPVVMTVVDTQSAISKSRALMGSAMMVPPVYEVVRSNTPPEAASLRLTRAYSDRIM